MVEQILRSVFAGLRALAEVAPGIAAMFTPGKSVDELESECFAALRREKRATAEAAKDLAERKARSRGDEPTQP